MPPKDRTILVVDDDARTLDLMQIVLKHAGYRVFAAPDGAAAQDLIAAERPDLTLADLMMPGMTGLELCEWARGPGGRPEMKFVLLTGMDDEETRSQAAAAGADDVVVKPFDRLGLLSRLADLLQP